MQKLDLSPRPAPIPDPPEGSGILGLSAPANGHPRPAPSDGKPTGKPVDVDFHMLLAEMQDDVTRSRLREAVWISVILHMVLFFTIPRIPNWFRGSQVELVNPQQSLKQKDLTFLELPPDMQKVKVKPDTSRISDKDRIATSKTPQIDPQALEHLRASRAPGAPGMNQTPQPPVPQQQAMNASPPPGASQQNEGWQQQQPPAQSRLQTPPAAQTPSFRIGGSASSMIENASRASAATHGGGIGGDNGAGPGRGSVVTRNNYEILSDTMGVDFGPYMQRVLETIRRNWYLNIPESAMPPLSKQGQLSIDFAIQPDGRVGGMRLSGPSGDTALDRAAWSGIALSDPFQPLPKEFKGPYLAVRIRFLYNPDRGTIR